MRWLLRFLAWATVLAPLFWLLSDAYHRALATTTCHMLGIPTDRLSLEPPEIPASHVLGVFAALCLASTRAPLARRLAALAVGLCAMVAIELLTGLLAIHWAMDALGTSPSGLGQRLRDHVTALPAWIGAPVVWLLLLGRWELPRADRRGPRPSAPAARACGALTSAREGLAWRCGRPSPPAAPPARSGRPNQRALP